MIKTTKGMKKILTSKFFKDKNTAALAMNLLGKFLVRKMGKKTISALITETEAYDGFKDKASHAHRGKTARNFPMFESAGRWYVYFTYGMHWMLNIVTGPKDYPAAILIRSVYIPTHHRKTGYKKTKPAGFFINGPAKLTKFLKIDKKLNNKPASRRSDLWIEDRGVKILAGQIKKGPRIGVAYAGQIWSKKPYRFYLKSPSCW